MNVNLLNGLKATDNHNVTYITNVNHLEVTNKMRPYIRIHYSNVSCCSTCFERHIAHHRELKNCICSLWFYIRHTDTVFELLVMSDVSLEACWAIRNVGIINSNTWSHLIISKWLNEHTLSGSRVVLCRWTVERIDRQTDMTNLVVVFSNFTKLPKNQQRKGYLTRTKSTAAFLPYATVCILKE